MTRQYEHTGEPIRRCKGCGAQIFWVKTQKGKWMPVTLKTLQPHWADCPAQEQFKKPRNKR